MLTNRFNTLRLPSGVELNELETFYAYRYWVKEKVKSNFFAFMWSILLVWIKYRKRH